MVKGLTCGRSVFVSIVGFDRARNVSVPTATTASTSACTDVTPPTSPTGFRQIDTFQDAVVLSWSPSSDDVGVVGYGVYRSGVLVAESSSPIVTLARLTCDATYRYDIDAVDAAGNRSRPTPVWVQTSACDDWGDAPSAPEELRVIAQEPSSVTLAWSAPSDGVGVTGYTVYIDGAPALNSSQLSAIVSGLSCGTTYVLGVDAFDAAGRRSPIVTVSSSTSPCVADPSPIPGSALDSSPPSPPGELAVTGATGSTISLSWAASSDDRGVAGYGLYVHGRRVASTTALTATISALSCGTSYVLGVDAVDGAGNRSTVTQRSASTARCEDTQPPTSPTSLVATSRTSDSIALSWSASSDDVGVVGYGLYRNGVLVGATSGTSGIFVGLACNTSYTLGVDAFDAAGNRSPRAVMMVSTSSCPDTSPPSAPTNLVVASIGETSLTLMWGASTDDTGVVGYDVYRGEARVATVTTTSYRQGELSCGTTYTFGVTAFDGAGNRSPRAQITVSTPTCPPPPVPASSGAAVAVAPSGNDSTCVRGDLAKPCATFRRAYEIAHCGDLVHVADGSYARQDLQGPDKSCSGGYVVFKGSRAAVVDEIKTAECCGRAVNGPDWIELNGFTLRNRLNGWGQADNWRVIGIDGGSFDINGPANWLLSGNDWGPCSSNTAPTCNGQNFAGGVSNLVIDGDTFHDFTITPGSGAHWECLFITGARGANVIRNSRFWNCETYGIYFSSFHSDHRYSTGSWTVENNWFGRTCCFGSSPRSSAINLGGSSPGEPVQNVLIRFNSFAPGQTLVREGGPTGSNLRAVGNIFGASGCVADVSYFYNLFRGGTCGQSGLTISEMPYVNGSDGAAMDYHLRSGSPAERYVAPTSSDYALAIDIDRQSRSSPRDAGSDQR
ncbi:MAG: hypothetical protein KatS3mg012_0917 [Gaiellaceae bacterium]|nr:MAG: hypothetical protein KatS3mg012_0917 [Gaiellaceae bacterium]